MPRNMSTVPSHYIRVLAQQLSNAGQDVESVLRALQLSPEVVREPRGMVLADQFVGLVQRSWQLIDDEYWGLTGQRCKPGHFALMVRYVHQFDTLSRLLTELCRFYSTTREDLLLSIESYGEQLYLYLDIAQPKWDQDHFFCEFMLTFLHRFICWITGKRIQLDLASFIYAKPSHAAIYTDLFPCQHKFKQNRCCLVFNNKYLSLPLIRNWPEVREYLHQAPADVMFMPGNDDRFSTRTKTILLDQFRREERFSDFNTIAKVFCVSPQTLRRKLQSENCSFQQIKDLIRRDIAIDKLTHEKLPIAEIGQQLGFVEPASFTRAFKQWTGLSPAEYRDNPC